MIINIEYINIMIINIMIINIEYNDNNDNKYRVYKCDSEASEYKPGVIKLDLTTPVKF
jgi:hypothetical protein